MDSLTYKLRYRLNKISDVKERIIPVVAEYVHTTSLDGSLEIYGFDSGTHNVRIMITTYDRNGDILRNLHYSIVDDMTIPISYGSPDIPIKFKRREEFITFISSYDPHVINFYNGDNKISKKINVSDFARFTTTVPSDSRYFTINTSRDPIYISSGHESRMVIFITESESKYNKYDPKLYKVVVNLPAISSEDDDDDDGGGVIGPLYINGTGDGPYNVVIGDADMETYKEFEHVIGVNSSYTPQNASNSSTTKNTEYLRRSSARVEEIFTDDDDDDDDDNYDNNIKYNGYSFSTAKKSNFRQSGFKEEDANYENYGRYSYSTTRKSRYKQSGFHNSSKDYKVTNDGNRILCASWNQANSTVFQSGFSGSQCGAMVVANIVRAMLIKPGRWTREILDENMIEGDALYTKIRRLCNEDSSSLSIDVSGYLEIRHMQVIRNGFDIFGKTVSINYDEDTNLYGSLHDEFNTGEIGMTLKQAIETLFSDHSAGSLIASPKTYGVMKYDDKYYFTDSHSCCTNNGDVVSPSIGTACVIECDTIDNLVRVCKRATGSVNQQFTLNYIDVNYDNSEETPMSRSSTRSRYSNEVTPVRRSSSRSRYSDEVTPMRRSSTRSRYSDEVTPMRRSSTRSRYSNEITPMRRSSTRSRYSDEVTPMSRSSTRSRYSNEVTPMRRYSDEVTPMSRYSNEVTPMSRSSSRSRYSDEVTPMRRSSTRSRYSDKLGTPPIKRSKSRRTYKDSTGRSSTKSKYDDKPRPLKRSRNKHLETKDHELNLNDISTKRLRECVTRYFNTMNAHLMSRKELTQYISYALNILRRG
ncbi:hypothetical protein [Trichoplusia ni ascovirus 2c]|uniref:hypothetical protein n=1 Tax=Trichoplusia ni ascovirus 2c TaxID=328615 RepID=UPI0000E441DA|nr:hypothetical protein TNAV2c_gp002 [Trichoplusia ni ascovirus 2c]ABF70519.1 hypothetical protein [Trichoplusia ni ascovirus 2c]